MTTQEMIKGLNDGTIQEIDLSQTDWYDISASDGLTMDFIREHADYLDWQMVSLYQHLSEAFIREYQDRVDWCEVSIHQHLSEGFIREYCDRVDWTEVSHCQHLSESFIREFSERVEWRVISRYQHLSERFIREFSERVEWWVISRYQHLSEGFIQKYRNKLNLYVIRDNWSYKVREGLEQAVRETGLYECHEDYFVAYKGIRSDRYSRYNFQFQYLPGETYVTFADASDSENFFGFSVWTKEEAASYCSELVVPCKVYYQDVARVVHDGGKIRCRKLTVLA